MYAGVEAQGAEAAAYHTALIAELCKLTHTNFSGGAADIYKCFDQIVRPLIYKQLDAAGMPEKGAGALYKIFGESNRIQYDCRGSWGCLHQTDKHTPGRPHVNDGDGTAPAALDRADEKRGGGTKGLGR